MNKLLDVSLMRVFAVVFLVLWHCYCPYMFWGYESPINDWYSFVIETLIPDANMPLFTFISGYLFCFLLKKGKYQNFKEFFFNKSRRLLIPFFVIGSLMNLTQFEKNIVDLLYGKPNHLWYCLMLFYCFIVCWYMVKYKSKASNMALLVVSCVSVLVVGFGALNPNVPLGILLPVYYYCYFYMGFLVFENKNELLKFLEKKWIWVLLLHAIIVAVTFFANRYYGCRDHLILFRSATFILLLFYIANLPLVQKKFYDSKFVMIISQYSFGIYVFHQYIIWQLTRAHIEWFDHLVTDYYLFFPIVFYVLVFSFSTLLTHLCLKTKIGRFLLA